jgi:hypothetical protein
MIPFLRRGAYTVLVNGTPAGFVRSARRQFWFLDARFASGAPDTFTLVRDGELPVKPAWKAQVKASGISFRRGWILSKKGPVPPALIQGRGRLPRTGGMRAGSGAVLQIDPGVVAVWSGRSAGGSTPDVGFGLAYTVGGAVHEVFVPRRGQTDQTEITVDHSRRLSDRDAAEKEFLRVTQGQNLAYADGGLFLATSYAMAQGFWTAFGS